MVSSAKMKQQGLPVGVSNGRTIDAETLFWAITNAQNTPVGGRANQLWRAEGAPALPRHRAAPVSQRCAAFVCTSQMTTFCVYRVSLVRDLGIRALPRSVECLRWRSRAG